MNRLLKSLAGFVFVGLLAATVVSSCGRKAAEADQPAGEHAKDSTDHPAGEHPKKDSTEHPTEHPADSTKK